MKMNFKELFNNASKQASKYSPEILTGLGIAGMVSAGVMAVSATPKAIRMVETVEGEVDRDLTRKEVVKVTWKCYIPAASTAFVSAACLIGSSRVNAKRNAMLATAYKISETALTDFKEKTLEVVGDEKVKEIKDKVAQKKVDENPLEEEKVHNTGNGDDLMYDVMSGRYFRSDIVHVERAINKLNSRLRSENYVSLNEYYYEIGLRSIKLGDTLGWNLNDGEIDPHFSSRLSGTKPCVIVDYLVAPRADFTNLY